MAASPRSSVTTTSPRRDSENNAKSAASGPSAAFTVRAREVPAISCDEFVKKTTSALISHPLTPDEKRLIGKVSSVDKHTETTKRKFRKDKVEVVSCNFVRKRAHPVSLRKFYPVGSFNVNLIERWTMR